MKPLKNVHFYLSLEGNGIRQKRAFFRGFKIVITTACVFMMFTSNEIGASQMKETGIIAAAKLNVRQEPAKSAPIIKVLKKGAQVIILKHTDNGWLKVSHNNQVGYIRYSEKYVRIISQIKKENDRIDIQQAKVKDINRKIKKQKAEIANYSKKEAIIIRGLNEIDLALNNTRQRTATLQSELDGVEKEIITINQESNILGKKITKTEEYACKRLVALYKLNQLGRMHIIASAESMFELFNRKTAMELILASDETILEDLMANKKNLSALADKLDLQKKEKLSIEADLQKQTRIMSHDRDKREKLLEDIRNKKSLGLAAIESLKQAAKALDQTILSLHVEPESSPKNKIKNFSSYKGLLKMPIQGKIIAYFGQYNNTRFNVVNFRSGIEIKADRGEPIRTVCDGRILYSRWFKGYGNMIIVDHGSSYYTVYAHAEEIFKVKGDKVDAGEVIATVGDTASMVGSCLYFEIRHHGKPLDPLIWLKKKQKG